MSFAIERGFDGDGESVARLLLLPPSSGTSRPRANMTHTCPTKCVCVVCVCEFARANNAHRSSVLERRCTIPGGWKVSGGAESVWVD